MPFQHKEGPPDEPWHSFLLELDAIVTEETHLHCIGGFVVTRLYGLPRPTADVDALSIAPIRERLELTKQAGKGSDLHKKHKVYLDYVAVASCPLNYDERLSPMFPVYERLRLFALEAHDLALTKLARNIARDREDVRYLARAIPLDLDLLRSRYQEEYREYVIGRKEDHDVTLDLWIDMINEDRANERR